jgi:TusA-related sulfurtransferase
MIGNRRNFRVKGKVDYKLDVRGMISPFSLLKVSLVFQQMKPCQVVEIIGCDPDMQRDLLRILPDASCEVVCTEHPTTTMEISKVRLEKRNPIDVLSLKRKYQ